MIASLFIWGFIQSFIVGLIIPMVKKATNNYILSTIFLVTALNILVQYLLRFEGLKFSHPNFLIVPDTLDLFLPTIVLLYINTIMGKTRHKDSYKYLIIPLLWSMVLLIYVNTTKNFGVTLYLGSLFHIISLGVIFSWKIFVFFKGIQLFKFQDENLKQKQASLMVWPRVIVIFLGLSSYIALINLSYWLITGSDRETYIADLMQQLVSANYVIFTCSIIFITIYFSFKYPRILSGLPVIKTLADSKFPEGEKYEEQLNLIIQEKKIHLDTELNEKKLAEALGVHSYILSRLLNDHIGKSFSEYINEKRIEEAIEILKVKENDSLTIFAVAIDSGFRSESVFYVNFKKITGFTPTQYKKQLLDNTKI